MLLDNSYPWLGWNCSAQPLHHFGDNNTVGHLMAEGRGNPVMIVCVDPHLSWIKTDKAEGEGK